MIEAVVFVRNEAGAIPLYTAPAVAHYIKCMMRFLAAPALTSNIGCIVWLQAVLRSRRRSRSRKEPHLLVKTRAGSGAVTRCGSGSGSDGSGSGSDNGITNS
jgi:hypothetical protein